MIGDSFLIISSAISTRVGYDWLLQPKIRGLLYIFAPPTSCTRRYIHSARRQVRLGLPPILLHNHALAVSQGLDVEYLQAGHYRLLQVIPESLEKEIDYANVMIDMLIISTGKTRVNTGEFAMLPIVQCIEDVFFKLVMTSFAGDSTCHSIVW